MELEKAMELIEKERTQRSMECAKEISEILKKYNCEFQPYINVIAKENK